MKRRIMVLGLAVLLAFPMGCGGDGKDPKKPDEKTKLTPEQIAKLCNDAGQAAALSWVIAAKPTPDEIDKVKVVADAITEAMKDYQGSGFVGMLPEIDKAIAKLIPGTDERSVAERKLAHLLASNALVALDDLFAKHPDWEQKGSVAAGYVAAFTTGVKQALTTNAAQARAAAKK